MVFVRLVVIVPVLVTLLAPSLATAGGDEQRAQQLEQRRERLQQKWEQQFRAADLDGDRRLSREEAVNARLPKALLDRFDAIDLDGDCTLSPEELLTAQEKRGKNRVLPANEEIGDATVKTTAP